MEYKYVYVGVAPYAVEKACNLHASQLWEVHTINLDRHANAHILFQRSEGDRSAAEARAARDEAFER